MAFPTAVNDQITDSITQSNLSVLGISPAQAIGALYQSMAHSSGLAAENAVANQQNSNSISSAVVSKCVAKLLDKS